MHPTCLLLLLLAPVAAPSQFTPKPKAALRSGHVTVCQPGNGCDEQVIGGRHVFTLQSDGYLLRVTSGTDTGRGYADVTITNQTGAPQSVNPADFRMEEESTHLHRLSYLDPNQPSSQQKAPREAKVHDLPPPGYWTSDQRSKDRQREQRSNPGAAQVPLLHPGTIAPAATVTGRVYFERPRTNQAVTVFLALPGALFEFPSMLPTAPKGKRPARSHDNTPG